MYCNECKKRNICVSICTKVEKYISKDHISRRELPLPDNQLFALWERYLNELNANFHTPHSQLAKSLKHALEHLPQKQKLIIEMTFVDGLSIREIAEKLGINKETVKSRLVRGLKNLKKRTLKTHERGVAPLTRIK